MQASALSRAPEWRLQGGSIIHEHNIVYKISGLKKRFSADAGGVNKMHFFAGGESEAINASEANRGSGVLMPASVITDEFLQ
ncbi:MULTISPECIES: hypothetical protein [Rhizobium]|uniref:hypothetical protein n=1 Tax=Rhizobium TaxID=379 RepID=UPI0019567512|nr:MULTISPECIES: hypothetical protein [Rhizobium]MBM7049284.1 hypothetical protein [Rhizobium lusitanum]